ncbi:MAG: DUF1800 domain-containing protein [Pseudomonadota bacterium]
MAISVRTLAAIRYGYGFRPDQPPPADAEALLARLGGPVPRQLPAVPRIESLFSIFQQVRAANRAMLDGARSAEAQRKRARQALRAARAPLFARRLLAPLLSPDGFGERLVTFWADHFTVEARGAPLMSVAPHLIETAVRPNIAGRFSDMLFAVETHPAMLIYLNQNVSLGPNSPAARRSDRGLNENLAREILELHTLGVGAGYSQTDVRELAELLTGLTSDNKTGMKFLPNRAEPGTETVLGRVYGGDPAQLGDIAQVLDDLARHPDTARHIARKLAVHFVSDTPDERLVAHIAAAWQRSGGDLSAVYAATLEHPGAWAPTLSKARQPYDFMIATMRAFGLGSAANPARPQMLRRVGFILLRMGQKMMDPAGPNGWPEEAEAWITPQGLAGRMEAAREFSRMHAERLDPRAFLETALRDAASERLRFAVSAAEQKWEGLLLTLLSPEFNRR